MSLQCCNLFGIVVNIVVGIVVNIVVGIVVKIVVGIVVIIVVAGVVIPVGGISFSFKHFFPPVDNNMYKYLHIIHVLS